MATISNARNSKYRKTGSGSPEGVVTAPLNAIYVDTDTDTKYEKTTLTGNTGWVQFGGGGGGGTNQVFINTNL